MVMFVANTMDVLVGFSVEFNQVQQIKVSGDIIGF